MPEHQCHVCGKTFTHPGNLHIHMRKHTEKYNCPTCGKNFSTKKILGDHQLTHTGEKPYTCLTCEKSFSNSGTLHHHRVTHTGVKPHTCPICKRAFSLKHHLHSHMRTQHPVPAMTVTTESHEEAVGTVTSTTHTFGTAQVYTEVTYISSRIGFARVVTQQDQLTATTSITQSGETISHFENRTPIEQEAVEALLELGRAESTDE